MSKPPRTGKGKFVFSDKSQYEGEWIEVDGRKMKHGRGVFTTGNDVVEGIWKYDVLDKSKSIKSSSDRKSENSSATDGKMKKMSKPKNAAHLATVPPGTHNGTVDVNGRSVTESDRPTISPQFMAPSSPTRESQQSTSSSSIASVSSSQGSEFKMKKMSKPKNASARPSTGSVESNSVPSHAVLGSFGDIDDMGRVLGGPSSMSSRDVSTASTTSTLSTASSNSLGNSIGSFRDSAASRMVQELLLKVEPPTFDTTPVSIAPSGASEETKSFDELNGLTKPQRGVQHFRYDFFKAPSESSPAVITAAIVANKLMASSTVETVGISSSLSSSSSSSAVATMQRNKERLDLTTRFMIEQLDVTQDELFKVKKQAQDDAVMFKKSLASAQQEYTALSVKFRKAGAALQQLQLISAQRLEDMKIHYTALQEQAQFDFDKQLAAVRKESLDNEEALRVITSREVEERVRAEFVALTAEMEQLKVTKLEIKQDELEAATNAGGEAARALLEPTIRSLETKLAEALTDFQKNELVLEAVRAQNASEHQELEQELAATKQLLREVEKDSEERMSELEAAHELALAEALAAQALQLREAFDVELEAGRASAAKDARSELQKELGPVAQQLEAQIVEAGKTLRVSEDARKRLERSLEQINGQREVERQKLHDEYDDRIAQLESALQHEQRCRTEIEARAKSLSGQLLDLESELEIYGERNAELSVMLKQRDKDTSAVEAVQQSAQKREAELQKEISRLENVISYLESRKPTGPPSGSKTRPTIGPDDVYDRTDWYAAGEDFD